MPEREHRPGREAACQICNAPGRRAQATPAVPGRRTLEATNIARRDGFSEAVRASPGEGGFEPADD